MNDKKYYRAYKEVIEILKYVPKEEKEKIPNKMINMFEEKMDKNYLFKYDESKSFAEQELMIETKAILANIFRDYWATPEQKEKIIAKQNYDRKKAEEEKREKYNPDNLFIKKENNVKTEKNVNAIVVYKESIIKRIINRIKKIFQR